jgi:hypothetical protein
LHKLLGKILDGTLNQIIVSFKESLGKNDFSEIWLDIHQA